MISEENYKMNESKKYNPPDNDKKKKFLKNDKEMMLLGLTNPGDIEENAFAPKERINPFFKGNENNIKNLKTNTK
jgi:hypothetical protein